MTRATCRTRNQPRGTGLPAQGRWLALALVSLLLALPGRLAAQEPPSPSSAREWFNAGTRQLEAGKLREAELHLETALTSHTERLYPASLYNLGHVRFRQGVEELKKGPPSGPVRAQARATSSAADAAIQAAKESLASGEVQRMLDSYLRGRGSRRELRAALKAVRAAIDAHGKTLGRWQRASSDFRSTLELAPKNDDARHNAEAVDQAIAKLIDSLQELQQLAAALGQQNEDLREQMRQLRGRIPEPDMPPGAAGDDEEEEEMPKEPEKGQEEAPSKPGEEMTGLTPEQAAWLLEGFKLDSGRPLPMGESESPEPRDRKGRDW